MRQEFPHSGKYCSKFQLTPKQHKVVHLLEHSRQQHLLKDRAANVIAKAWRTYQATYGQAKSIAE
jgi:hypothetical protein